MPLKEIPTQPRVCESEKNNSISFANGKNKVFLILTGILVWVSALCVILFALIIIFSPAEYVSENFLDEPGKSTLDKDCNIQGIAMHGGVVTYISNEGRDSNGNIIVDEFASEDVVAQIWNADRDENVKAIIVEIDSYGGSPVAGEEIARALKEAEKPTVALIRDMGASAAYMAGTGADIIFASKNSNVGGIGVTMSYLDNAEQNIENGLNYNQLSAGDYKDTGSSDKKLSTEEKALLMRDVNIVYENFIDLVAVNRNLDSAMVRKLADGSTMMGQMALEQGLIDRIGDQYDVEKYLEELLGESIKVCW